MRWLIRTVGLIIALPAAYLLAAFIGGQIEVNRNWVATESGLPVYLISNGVHTDLAVPAKRLREDWRPWFFPGSAPPLGDDDYIAFGWGDRDFYLQTRTWADVDVRRSINALFFASTTVLHLSWIQDPQRLSKVKVFALREDEFERLVNFLERHFKRDSDGNVMRIENAGYGPMDHFFESTGNYNFVMTCNEWTGRALRAAGVRVGVWTPFAFNLP